MIIVGPAFLPHLVINILHAHDSVFAGSDKVDWQENPATYILTHCWTSPHYRTGHAYQEGLLVTSRSQEDK
jgi:hypothetical protein